MVKTVQYPRRNQENLAASVPLLGALAPSMDSSSYHILQRRAELKLTLGLAAGFTTRVPAITVPRRLRRAAERQKALQKGS